MLHEQGQQNEQLEDVIPIFGALPVNARVPFISHNAQRFENNPLPDQYLTVYDVFVAAYVYAVSEDHTRLERTFPVALDGNGNGDGIVTYFANETLHSDFDSIDHIGGIEPSYSNGSHSPEIKVPFIDVRLGDPTLNDIANSLVTLRIRGYLASDLPDDRDSDARAATPSFDTGDLTFMPELADFKVRIYPYHVVGSRAIYTPATLVGATHADIKPNLLRVTVTGVKGLVTITIPSLHGQTLKNLAAGIEASLVV